jgi:hypothetical protein
VRHIEKLDLCNPLQGGDAPQPEVCCLAAAARGLRLPGC